MGSFQLSPGITPELVSTVVVAFPLVLMAGYLLGRGRGFEAAFAASAVALSVVKFLTEPGDLGDDVVALVGAAAGATMLRLALVSGGRFPVPRPGLALVGLLGVLIGAVKAIGDPLDPYDLLLAAVLLASGAFLVAFWVHGGRRPVPTDRVRES